MSAGEISFSLKEKYSIDRDAASVLKKAEISAESEIQSLSQEDLHELFPGVTHLQRRLTIFQKIQQNKQSQDAKAQSGHFSDVHCDTSTLADHLPYLKFWNEQLKKLHNFLEDHIKVVENSVEHQPGQEGLRDKNGTLLKEIEQKIDRRAAETLKKIKSDFDLQLLGRKDLLDLFPKNEEFKRRRAIFGIIHKQRPTSVLSMQPKDLCPEINMPEARPSGTLSDLYNYLKEMKKFPNFFEDYIKVVKNYIKAREGQKPFKGEHSDSRMLADYLPHLKAWMSKMNDLSSFLNNQIKFVEDTAKAPAGRGETVSSMDISPSPNYYPDNWQGPHRGEMSALKREKEINTQTESQKRYFGLPSIFSWTSNSQMPNHLQKEYDTSKGFFQSTKEKLTYQVLVSGETFDGHRALLEQIKSSIQGITLVEVDGRQNSQESQIIILFCPVVSRVGTDVIEAMKAVTDNRPVILVLMHHAYEPKHVSSGKSWNFDNIILHVNVFFHETKGGLIQTS